MTGASIFFIPVVVAKANEYEGSDVIVSGGSVLALVGAVLGAAVGFSSTFAGGCHDSYRRGPLRHRLASVPL